MQKPELLMPAGNLDKLKIAFQYGADVVYAGIPSLSLRMRVNDFDNSSLEEGISYAHKLGKKIYITVNIFPHNEKISLIKENLKWVSKNKPDAVIISDLGVLRLANEICPKIPIHVSTQANTVNYESAKFWRDLGAKRIILGRELSLKEIAEIHKKVSGIEFEAFCHGSMCMAYSGRCFLSMFMAGRDANQGDCAHPCRWKYKAGADCNPPLRKTDINYSLEEQERPGEMIPIEEDDQGVHIMSSKDLCMIEHIKAMISAGICSLKVEGRAKTEIYIATIAKAYRKAIDDVCHGDEFDKKLLDEVQATSHRDFFTGFYFGKPGPSDHTFKSTRSFSTHDFVGLVVGKKGDLYEIEIRNPLEPGDEVEILTPNDLFEQKVDHFFDLNGKLMERAHGGIGKVLVKLDYDLPKGTVLRKLKI